MKSIKINKIPIINRNLLVSGEFPMSPKTKERVTKETEELEIPPEIKKELNQSR